jgi:hypothetical protein
LDSVRNFYLQEDTKHFGLMKSTKTAMQTTTKKQTNGLNEIIGLAQHFLTNGCKRLSWTVRVSINQQRNLKTVEIGLEAWLDHLHGKQEAMCSKPTTEKTKKQKAL